ncbi:MAG: PUA domain-containing protein [Promethearchaeota archaeon]
MDSGHIFYLKGFNIDLQIKYILDILEYQYGKAVADIFKEILSNISELKIQFSKKTNKIKQIIYRKNSILTYKPNVGRFSITLYGAYILHQKLEFPKLRVVVVNSVFNFIKDGKSAFTKHIIDMDPELRIGDDVLIVDEEDHLLGVGKLLVPPLNYKGFSYGVAVDVKKGMKKLEKIKLS